MVDFKEDADQVHFFNVTCVGETEKAIRVDGPCWLDAEWVPQSQVTSDSEVWEKDQEGTLVVTRWIAEEKGWI